MKKLPDPAPISESEYLGLNEEARECARLVSLIHTLSGATARVRMLTSSTRHPEVARNLNEVSHGENLQSDNVALNLVDPNQPIAGILSEIGSICPEGFSLALHVKFTTPSFIFQTMPANWLNTYSSQGLVLQDPTITWSFEETGTIRWSELAEDDPAGFLELAKKYGLLYGFTVALNEQGSRTMGSFTRSDREFLDVEIEKIVELAFILHEMTLELKTLSPRVIQELKKINVLPAK